MTAPGSSTLTPTSWQPPNDLVAATVARLKTEHAALWREIKELERQNAGLRNRAGDALTLVLRQSIPDHDVVKVANLRLCIRGIARAEAGLSG